MTPNKHDLPKWARGLRFLAALPLFFPAGLSAAEVAQLESPVGNYGDCSEMVGKHPGIAYEMAEIWMRKGGGDPARHCAALALFELGRYAAAAKNFEELGRSLPLQDSGLRVQVLAQAGQAWVLAGDLERALAAQSEALKILPSNPELLIDRAVTLASSDDYQGALRDLNRAYELLPDRPDVLVYRATTLRFLGQEQRALDDVETALRLAPDMPEAHLERGILRRLSGDLAGAKEDWDRVVALAAGSPEAAAARSNIERLAALTGTPAPPAAAAEAPAYRGKLAPAQEPPGNSSSGNAPAGNVRPKGPQFDSLAPLSTVPE